MPADPRRPSLALWRTPTGVLVIAAALVMVGLAAWLTPERWLAIAQHPDPARLRTPEPLRQGASWLRVMLVVAALLTPVGVGLIARFARRSGPPVRLPAWPPFGRRAALGVIVLAVLAPLLRLNEGVWYDEVAAWTSFGIHGPGVVIGNLFDLANHIGHSLAAWVSFTLFEPFIGWILATRLPSWVAHVVTVCSLMGIGRELDRRRIALIAGALAALAPVMILEAAEARGYAMVMALGAAATWVNLMRTRRGDVGLLLLYALLATLAVWTHFVAAMFFIGHGVVHLLALRDQTTRRHATGSLIALGLAAVWTLTLYAPALPDLLARRAMLQNADEGTPGLFGAEGVRLFWQFGGAWTAWAAAPGLALFAVGFVAGVRTSGTRRALGLLLAGLPVLIATVLIADVWVYARFALFIMPGALFAIALGLVTLWGRVRPVSVLAAAALVASWGADLALRPPKQPLREAMAIVDERREPDDEVLAIGLAHGVLEAYRPSDLVMVHSLRHGRDLPERLPRLDPPPAWAVMLYPHAVSDETFATLDEAGYVEVERLPGWVDWGRGEVVIYHRSLLYR